jgi:hypothetical protein
MQVDQKDKTQILMTTLSPIQTFHRTNYRRARETTIEVPQKLGTLELFDLTT